MGILFKTWQELPIHNLHDHHLVQTDRMEMGGEGWGGSPSYIQSARDIVPSGEHVGQEFGLETPDCLRQHGAEQHVRRAPVLFVESALWFSCSPEENGGCLWRTCSTVRARS